MYKDCMTSKRIKRGLPVLFTAIIVLCIGLAAVLWAVQKYSFDVRSRAVRVCPVADIPPAEVCQVGWTYSPSGGEHGCPAFICRENGGGRGKSLVHKQVCPGPGGKDSPRCHARVIVDAGGSPKTTFSPLGFGPKQLRGAYNVNGRASSGVPLIAIVTAYDNPNIKTDLDTYSKQFGLPLLPLCKGDITASPVPCFKKIDQNGGVAYPQANTSWALETALDTEIVHAMCENCSILLVEATTGTYDNLLAAVDRARMSGARIISNSWGSTEFSGENTFESHFPQPGYVYTFSSGDSGYGTQYPAASPNVTAVGGTSLTISGTNAYVSENVWAGAGSGCSAYEPKFVLQTDSLCTKRMVADVSAVANPNTGAAIYDATNGRGKSAWFVLGGTSLASPIIASMYALAGGVRSSEYGPYIPYQKTTGTNLHDILNGSNGTCAGSYFCTAVPGYDGPTGLGSPNGLSAF